MTSPSLLLTEAELGCLMVRLPLDGATKILRWSEAHIQPSDLADDGIEHEIHVTIAYGFTADVQADEVFDAVEKITGGDPLVFQLGDISRFATNPEYDVIKVEVTGPALARLHYGLRAVFKERLQVTFPDYKAHLTLAYVKKGARRDLDGHGKFNGETHIARLLVYSEPNSARKHLTLMNESVAGLVR